MKGRTVPAANGLGTPLVSVIIPTYNAEPYIAETVRSVLAQTYRPLEIVVIDDGSTDGTVGRVRALGQGVEILQQANAGVAVARNRAAKRARGTFLAFLDADDLWTPDKLEKQMAIFRRHPEVAVVSATCDEIDERGHGVPRVIRWPVPLLDRVVDLHRYLLRRRNVVALSASVVRRTAFEEAGGFYTKERILSADYELWIRLSERYRFYIVSERLCHYRVLAESMIHGSFAKEYGAQLRILDLHRHRFSRWGFRARESMIYRDWADSALFEGDAEGWGMWRQSLLKNPLNVSSWLLGLRTAVVRTYRRYARNRYKAIKDHTTQGTAPSSSDG